MLSTYYENTKQVPLSRQRERAGVRPKVALWPVDMLSKVFPLTSFLSPGGEEDSIYFLDDDASRRKAEMR